jgi:predicted Zn-dependent protease
LVWRALLRAPRAQESAADQAGLRFLDATHQSGRGMLATFERFAEQEFWSAKDIDPFVRSHPVAASRINQLRERVEASPYADAKDPPELQFRHDMMRAKLDGHVLPLQAALNRYPASNTSLPARYARAIARNCSGNCAQSLGEIDALIRERPEYPFFWELRGELLVKAGQAPHAIESLRRAVSLLERQKRTKPTLSLSQTNILLARALVDANNPGYLEEAIKILTQTLGADKPLGQGEDDDWMGWYQLAIAYQRKGNEAEALLATARKHFYSGNAKDIREAQIYAKRAQGKFPRGSRGWLIAEDIITYKIPA